MVVLLAAATEEVSVLEDSVAVAMARVLEGLEEEVVVTSLAFLEPQLATAFLQAR